MHNIVSEAFVMCCFNVTFCIIYFICGAFMAYTSVDDFKCHLLPWILASFCEKKCDVVIETTGQ